jgi:AraC-like DNA-binding protein
MSDNVRFHRFPLAGIDAMSAATSRSFARHTHDQYGVGVIDDGGHASASDRKQVEAGPGDLIFVNPGEIHDGRAIGGRSRSWRMLYIDPSVMDAARTDVRDGAKSSITFAGAVHADECLRHLFNVAFSHVNGMTERGDRMACETALLRLVARLDVNSASAARREAALTPPVRRARDRIDADPSAPLTLADLAAEIGTSRYQLLRAFARELGTTPHAYIVQRRIALARRLIREGTPLVDAATIAGFSDQSHLTRRFVCQFGVTPGRYSPGAR